jgi:amino acid adenylation domain-containing protein/thioester reductase-like protein
MEQFFGGSVANITGTIMFTESIESSALLTAINKTVYLHDALRIRIRLFDGIPMQYVREYTPCIFETAIFSTSNHLDSWVKEIAQSPFDLSGDLFKFFIVTVGGRIGFVFHLHHLIADAWGAHLIVNTVMLNLKDACLNVHSYLNYLDVEREYKISPRFTKDREYFLSLFEHCCEPVYLSDKQAVSTRAEHVHYVIGHEKSALIHEFCVNNSISPYTLFMTALSTYIYRVKGATTLFIGSSVLNRAGREEKETAGMFVNTIPVLCRIDENNNMLYNLRLLSENIAGVFRHQRYQYANLLKDIRNKYGFSGRLFDVVLNYQNAVISEGIETKFHFCGCQGESLIIHINDRYKEGALHFDYTYQIESFSSKDIELLHERLTNLVFSMLSNPNLTAEKLKLLSGDEYNRVIHQFNNTGINYPKNKCIHQIFEEQVKRTPNKVAVIFEKVEYTYQQINNMANSLAHKLRNRGVGQNDIVAIISKRSYKIIVAQLAILKSGGAYMPIDPKYPIERIKFMLSDAQCKVVLTLEAPVNGIDMADETIFNGDTTLLKPVNTSEDLCYVIYTSGSTGKPKGAMITHRNFVNFCNNNKNNIHVTIANRCETFLHLGAFTFDMASAEVFLCLLNNHTLIMANENQLEKAADIAQLTDFYSIDFILSTPTKLLTYMNDTSFTSAMRNLKVLAFGGESISKDIVSFFKVHTDAIILNGYGPTETTQGCTWTTVEDDITIGKPIANTQIYILDVHQNAMPIGLIGELCISGDGVGRGYLNLPDLTATKFIQSPFNKDNIIYKTGDLAYWREDGNVVFVGRIDNQIKIRGLRIELGEIETAIYNYNGIKQVCVVEKRDTSGRQFICAYYVGNDIDISLLKNDLKKTLPLYMIPHFFMHVDSFPTTPNGKIDYKALPSLEYIDKRSIADYVAPITEKEKDLVVVFETVLGVAKVGMNDSFFDLGGDSLKAIEFAAKAQNMGFTFSIQDIFEYQSPDALLRHISDTGGKAIRHRTEDFSEIHTLIEKNKINYEYLPVKHQLGDTFITGATGWLGAHVLDAFLSSEQGVAYCLVRGKNTVDSQCKLEATLENYFGDKYKKSTRIIAICGDIVSKVTSLPMIKSIIHCAANVKHYGDYQHFYDVNVMGTENIISLAQNLNARLIHISTTSVSGDSLEQSPALSKSVFDETKLYIGQSLDNVYIRSKFESEVAVLRARINGLNAMVMRVGNLTNRYSDLVFQKNYSENAMLTRLKVFIDLGIYPEKIKDFQLEFSPVDDTAKAIVKLAQYAASCHSVFHVNNNIPVCFADFAIIAGLSIISNEEFNNVIRDVRLVPNTAQIHDIVSDQSMRNRDHIITKSDFTTLYLKKLGFNWSKIDTKYLNSYIEYFSNKDYWRSVK